jgi:hypothetical protein
VEWARAFSFLVYFRKRMGLGERKVRYDSGCGDAGKKAATNPAAGGRQGEGDQAECEMVVRKSWMRFEHGLHSMRDKSSADRSRKSVAKRGLLGLLSKQRLIPVRE